MLVLTQFPPRLLLTGAVLTALTASAGTVLTFPAVTALAPQPPGYAPIAAAPAPAPATPPQADGAQIAGLAATPPAAPAPRTGSERTAADAAPERSVDVSGRGLSEADWARLPASLRERVRTACDAGYLKGPHCDNA